MKQRGLTDQGRGPGSERPEAVSVRLLGGFRVSVGARTIAAERWRLRKAAGLIKLLALAPGHALHRDQVTDALWPELAAGAAANNLHRVLHFARGLLGAAPSGGSFEYLGLGRELIELCPGGRVWSDVEAFEMAAAEARRSGDPAAYRAALDLYAGELLPEDRYEEWTEGRREGLRQLRLSLLADLAALQEDRGEHGKGIETLRSMLLEVPAWEEAHASLMRLYALSGRRQEALLQYGRMRETLSRELGVEPGAGSQRLYQQIKEGTLAAPRPPHLDRPPSDTAPSPRHNLPAPRTSFVGREREIVEARRLLPVTRLLTFTGAGGSGKTRLALEVCRDLVALYAEGVWLVELASLSDPALVPQAVAHAVGVREQPGRAIMDTLTGHLRDRDLLLIVDNCEHLIEAVARMTTSLLDSCPQLRVLTTSREPLGVPGEVVCPVLPLSVPGADRGPSAQVLMRSEAVGLFVDRARSRLPGFELTESNAGAVSRACTRLEGVPLAIELATARLGALTVEQVAGRLEDSLGLLNVGGRRTEPRHRTMRATLEWSHGLLSEPERGLFARLAVFAGGFTLEAAEEVCSGANMAPEEVLEPLSRLAEKSLVIADGGRYRMLEPIRQYAAEKFEEREEDAWEVRRRHASHYLSFAEKAEPELLGADQGEWLQRLRTELGNLRGALSWTLQPGEEKGRAALGLRLAAALWRFWDVEGFDEGKRWLQTALERDTGGLPVVRAKALGGLGWILLFQRDYGQAIAALEEAITLHTELGERSSAAFTLGSLGYAALHGGYKERIPAFVEEAAASLRDDIDDHTRAFLGMVLASAAMERGDLESAVARLEGNVELCRRLGDLRHTSMSLFTLAMAELMRENLRRGAELLEEGTRITRELGDRLAGVYYVWALGKVAALRGSPVRAARLWGAAEALREQMGMSLSHFDLAHSDYEADLACARSSIDAGTWEAAWAEGRSMSPEQATGYALSAREAPLPASVPRERPDALTRREREVATLVGRGLPNRKIAEELGITGRTVETHVGNILHKTGLRSRTQIASWIIQGQQSP